MALLPIFVRIILELPQYLAKEAVKYSGTSALDLFQYINHEVRDLIAALLEETHCASAVELRG